MGSHQEYRLENGKVWAVASLFFKKADVVIPIDQIAGMSDEEIGAYVRAMLPLAAKALADEILHEWEYYHRTPEDYAAELAEWLEPFSEEFAEIDEALGRLQYMADGGQYLSPKRDRDNSESDTTTKAKPGFVYLARAETGHYKIGRSKDPEARVEHFDTQMPIDVETIHIIPTNDMHRLEKELHDRFDDKRGVGEWFELAPEDVSSIRALTKKTYGKGQHSD